MPNKPSVQRNDLNLFLGLLLVLLFVSPFTDWWARLAPAWYFAYVLWAIIIIFAAGIAYRNRHEP